MKKNIQEAIEQFIRTFSPEADSSQRDWLYGKIVYLYLSETEVLFTQRDVSQIKNMIGQLVEHIASDAALADNNEEIENACSMIFGLVECASEDWAQERLPVRSRVLKKLKADYMAATNHLVKLGFEIKDMTDLEGESQKLLQICNPVFEEFKKAVSDVQVKHQGPLRNFLICGEIMVKYVDDVQCLENHITKEHIINLVTHIANFILIIQHMIARRLSIEIFGMCAPLLGHINNERDDAAWETLLNDKELSQKALDIRKVLGILPNDFSVMYEPKRRQDNEN